MGCSTTLSSSPLLPHHHHQPTVNKLHRRSLLFLSTSLSLPTPLSSSSTSPPPPPDTTITDRVFMDFSICPSYFLNRNLGDELSLCTDAEPVGRLVLGLYGNHVPITVSNFKAMCTGSCGSSYKGTLVQKIFPGQFFLAGKQGRKDKGEVKPPLELTRNTETVESKAFTLEHTRPGILSLCLSENDEEDDIKLDPNYHNVEFMITTGPGPCPQLDYKNIVFGAVLEGDAVEHEAQSVQVDPVKVPQGPVTRARAKRFKESLQALVRAVQTQEKPVIEGIELEYPCTTTKMLLTIEDANVQAPNGGLSRS